MDLPIIMRARNELFFNFFRKIVGMVVATCASSTVRRKNLENIARRGEHFNNCDIKSRRQHDWVKSSMLHRRGKPPVLAEYVSNFKKYVISRVTQFAEMAKFLVLVKMSVRKRGPGKSHNPDFLSLILKT